MHNSSHLSHTPTDLDARVRTARLQELNIHALLSGSGTAEPQRLAELIDSLADTYQAVIASMYELGGMLPDER